MNQDYYHLLRVLLSYSTFFLEKVSWEYKRSSISPTNFSLWNSSYSDGHFKIKDACESIHESQGSRHCVGSVVLLLHKKESYWIKLFFMVYVMSWIWEKSEREGKGGEEERDFPSVGSHLAGQSQEPEPPKNPYRLPIWVNDRDPSTLASTCFLPECTWARSWLGSTGVSWCSHMECGYPKQ